MLVRVCFSNFCIIEGPETVQDFGQMQFQEIQDNIRSRRNKIFLLMGEVLRLRIQQRLKNLNTRVETREDEYEMPDIPSTIPFLPNMCLVGWEKSENEVAVLKQQLEAAEQQNLTLDVRINHLYVCKG
ncbi:protein ORANGE, chloroplastic-like isoform X1 [Lycium barbarum]|uniref:protein ORANGE, chloroplastic-like isoform X1 n=2 Tax=Lycium barbarum TaxID=112863 RepID=UPI00293EA0F5|nr:protein ORANGE, chloroplastic-like isoform X1 [Lycium barbarum]